jgi:acyl carrier protein
MDLNLHRRVIELAAEHGGVDPNQVTPDHHFAADLNFDSLTATEFAMDLEDEFHIAVSDDQMQQMQTVGQAIAYVEQEVAKLVQASESPD